VGIHTTFGPKRPSIGRSRERSSSVGGCNSSRRTSEFPVIPLSIPTPFPVGPVNVYLIKRDPVTLIDTGPLTEEAWEALTASLARAGLKVADIRRVLLTHGHQDHFGLARRIAAHSRAQLLGGRLDREQFRMRRNAKLLLDSLARADFGLGSRFVLMLAVSFVDHFAAPLAEWDEISGGETLAGDGWSVVVRSTPGHTPGSLTFEIPEAGLLFTGDTVLRDITPNAIVDEDPERPGEAFRSVTRYFETLESIERSNASSLLLTGHGRPIPDYPAHRTNVRRKYALRIRQIERLLAAGPRTVRKLVTGVFPGIDAANLFLVYSEILGFLMYLEDEGRVERIAERLRDRYRLRQA
jgi:glyoxylase-like metal-dependent hydrolase (beta-lactamase superfamily II)